MLLMMESMKEMHKNYITSKEEAGMVKSEGRRDSKKCGVPDSPSSTSVEPIPRTFAAWGLASFAGAAGGRPIHDVRNMVEVGDKRCREMVPKAREPFATGSNPAQSRTTNRSTARQMAEIREEGCQSMLLHAIPEGIQGRAGGITSPGSLLHL